MNAPATEAPALFVSLRRPELGPLRLQTEDGSEGDVWPCERCDGVGEVAMRVRGDGDSYLDADVPCRAVDGGCDGTGWIHGYDDHGDGLPARPVGAA